MNEHHTQGSLKFVDTRRECGKYKSNTTADKTVNVNEFSIASSSKVTL
jgi:hypothetical protein